jgi:hypothetical protein
VSQEVINLLSIRMRQCIFLKIYLAVINFVGFFSVSILDPLAVDNMRRHVMRRFTMYSTFTYIYVCVCVCVCMYVYCVYTVWKF